VPDIAPQVVTFNGLYRHGFLISPAMLDVVMEWVQHHTTTLAEQFHLKFEHV
jgi:glycine oxidase